MSFKEDLAEDLRQVLNASEIDEAATYYPVDSATGFAVRAVRGDIQTGTAQFEQGTEHTRTCDATLLRSVVRAGIETIEGAERDPKHGDRLTFDEDDEATRSWYIAAPGAIDVGGAVTVQLVGDSYGNPGGRTANEVR